MHLLEGKYRMRISMSSQRWLHHRSDSHCALSQGGAPSANLLWIVHLAVRHHKRARSPASCAIFTSMIAKSPTNRNSATSIARAENASECLPDRKMFALAHASLEIISWSARLSVCTRGPAKDAKNARHFSDTRLDSSYANT